MLRSSTNPMNARTARCTSSESNASRDSCTVEFSRERIHLSRSCVFLFRASPLYPILFAFVAKKAYTFTSVVKLLTIVDLTLSMENSTSCQTGVLRRYRRDASAPTESNISPGSTASSASLRILLPCSSST